MAPRDAIVEGVVDITTTPAVSAAFPAGTQVTFAGGRVARLDPTDPKSSVWAAILDQQRRADRPAYVEIDPETSLLTELLVPIPMNVGELTETESGDLDVELIVSHARHYLRRQVADFDLILGRLRQASESGTTVLVTETLDHDIVDVRPLPQAHRPPPTGPPGERQDEHAPIAAATVTPDVAGQMFTLVNQRTCCPTSASAPCIPFTYPDDGCWGRAHEMARLMLTAGVTAAKVWIYGRLRAATINNPACEVQWGWHVAPTLSVTTSGATQTWVIDPALFTAPVPQSTWASVQGDPNASLVPTDSAVFYRGRDGSVSYDDASFSRTRGVLDTYRQQLLLRSVSATGPPPYPQCLPRPPGVQWVGTIAGGATARWFTYGWPASWHVLWTIMPLTTCAGAPQLSWSVQIERASATEATYWITVRNLTSAVVRFEGRYNVLSR